MDVQIEAAMLVKELASSCQQNVPIGTMSVSLYDTAWVAMISKVSNGRRVWLFPQCFQVILESQSTKGAWGEHKSVADDILSTMAALLALSWHRKDLCQDNSILLDLDSRISRAIDWLDGEIQGWDVSTIDHVGLEILVPALSNLLALEGISIRYPSTLSDLNRQKMAKFEPAVLYSTVQSTLKHSLEAFIGVIDFDQVSCNHMSRGMLGSPASTAAFLIYSSCWNNEAETYLQDVIQYGAGNGSGGVPSAFPSTIFELSWV